MNDAQTAPVVSKEQIAAAFQTTTAIAGAIRDLGSVPSGHLYAQVMDKISLETYTRVIDLLKRNQLVTESNHVLVWTAPKYLK